MRRLFLFLFATLGAFVPLSFVSAYTETTFPVQLATTTPAGGASYNTQQWSPLSSGKLSTITVKTTSTSTCFTASGCQLELHANNSLTVQSYFNFTATTSLATGYFTTFTSSDVGNSTTITAGTNYKITSNNGNFWLGTPPSSTYTNIYGYDQNCNGSNSVNCSGGLQNFDTWLAFDTATSTLDASYVDFISRPTLHSNFSQWILQYAVQAQYIGQTLSAGVTYQVNGVPVTTTDWVQFVPTNSGLNLILINLSSVFSSSTIVSSTAWIFSVSDGITDPLGFYIAQSNPYNFTVTSSLQQGGIFGWYTTVSNPLDVVSSTDPYAVCSYSNPIVYGFCWVMVSLFSPDQATKDQFITMTNLISTRAPFGYVSVYYNALEGTIESGYSGSTTIDTSISDQLGAWGPVVLFKRVLSVLLWLNAALWIFNRVRHITTKG